MAGLLVRVAALPLPGTEDVDVWKIWSFAGSYDATGVYGIGGDPPERRVLRYGTRYTTVDYPPLALLEMAVVGRVYRALNPLYENTWRLVLLLKLPGLVAGALLAWTLWWFVRLWTGDERSARWAALAFWLNPAAILNAEVLGYLDPLMMLPAVGAFALLAAGWPMAAGASCAAALLTKPQAMLVVPAFLLAVARRDSWRAVGRATVGAATVFAAVLMPFAAAGALPNMWLAFGSWYGRRDILSGNAANIWWVANYLCRAWNRLADLGFPQAYLIPVARVMAVSTFMDMGLPNPRPFATAAILLVCAWAAWCVRARRDITAHIGLAAFTVHTFFVLGVGVHEHHQMLSVPLLACLAALDTRYRRLFAAVSLIVALNMNLFYGLGRGWDVAVPRMSTPIDLTVLVALVNSGALAWHGWLLRTSSVAVLARFRPPQA